MDQNWNQQQEEKVKNFGVFELHSNLVYAKRFCSENQFHLVGQKYYFLFCSLVKLF
jgi:hypothetical protein